MKKVEDVSPFLPRLTPHEFPYPTIRFLEAQLDQYLEPFRATIVKVSAFHATGDDGM